MELAKLDSNTETKQKTTNGSEKSVQATLPDGGWGWVVVAASFTLHLIADGIIFSFGAFFVEFTKTFNQTESTTAWIGSSLAAMPLLSGPPAALLTDAYGCGKVTVVGGLLASLGFLLSSISTSITLLIISFGLISGSGISLCYIAGVDVIANYFEKRVSLATGLALCGGGIGTFIYAPIINTLLQWYEWQKATLILAGNFLVISLCGYLMEDLKAKKPKPGGKAETSSRCCNDNESALTCSYPPSSDHHQQSSKGNNCTLTRSSWEVAIPKRCKSTGFLPEKHEQELRRKRYYSCNQQLAAAGCFDGGAGGGVFVGVKQDFFKSHETCCTAGTDNRTIGNFDGVDNLGIRSKLFAYLQMGMNNVQGWINGMLLSIRDAVANRRFFLFLVSNFVLYTWYDIPYMYIQSTATKHGHSESTGSGFISIIGLAYVVGNVLLGFLGDKSWIKPTTIYALCTVACGLSTIAMPYAIEYSIVSVVASNTVFGLTIAANTALSTVMLVEMISLERLAFAYGFLMFIQGCGNLVGPPIAGVLSDWQGNTTASFIVAGVGIIISGFFLFAPVYHTQVPKKANSSVKYTAKNLKTDASPVDLTAAIEEV